MRIKLGKGWAPEKPNCEIETIAIRELRILFENIFNRKNSKFKGLLCKKIPY